MWDQNIPSRSRRRWPASGTPVSRTASTFQTVKSCSKHEFKQSTRVVNIDVCHKIRPSIRTPGTKINWQSLKSVPSRSRRRWPASGTRVSRTASTLTPPPGMPQSSARGFNTIRLTWAQHNQTWTHPNFLGSNTLRLEHNQTFRVQHNQISTRSGFHDFVKILSTQTKSWVC